MQAHAGVQRSVPGALQLILMPAPSRSLRHPAAQLQGRSTSQIPLYIAARSARVGGGLYPVCRGELSWPCRAYSQTQVSTSTNSTTDSHTTVDAPEHEAELTSTAARATELETDAINTEVDHWDAADGCDVEHEDGTTATHSLASAGGYSPRSNHLPAELAAAPARAQSHRPHVPRLLTAGGLNDDNEDFVNVSDEDDSDFYATESQQRVMAASVHTQRSVAPAAVVPRVPERHHVDPQASRRLERPLKFSVLAEAARRREPEDDYSAEAALQESGRDRGSGSRGAGRISPSSRMSPSNRLLSGTRRSPVSPGSSKDRPPELPLETSQPTSRASGIPVPGSPVRRREPEDDYSHEAAYVSARASSSYSSAGASNGKTADSYQVNGSRSSRSSPGSHNSSGSSSGSSNNGRGGGNASSSSKQHNADEDADEQQQQQGSRSEPPISLQVLEQVRELQAALEASRLAQLEAEARAERAEQHARDAHNALQQAQEVSTAMVQHYNTLRQELENFRERHMPGPRGSSTPNPSRTSTTDHTDSSGAALARTTPSSRRSTSPMRTRSVTREEEDEKEEQMLLMQLELDAVTQRLDQALRDLRAHQLVLVAQHEVALHLNGLPGNVAQYIYDKVDSGTAPLLGDGGSGSVHSVKIPVDYNHDGEQQYMEVAVKVVPLYDINTARAYHLRDICPLFLRPRSPHLDVPLATFLRLKPGTAPKDREAAGQQQPVDVESSYYLYTVWPRRSMDLDQLLCKRKLAPGEMLTIMHHTVLAVADLHAARMVHADIKPPNILVMLDQEGQVISGHLTDFGSVQYVAQGQEAAPAIWGGQLAWNWPPEQRDLVFLNGCDAWGAALVYSCMRTSNPTKPDLAEILQDEGTSQNTFDKIRDKELLPDYPDDPPEIRTLTRLMRRCVVKNPLKRPSLQELLHTTQALLTAYQQFRQ